MCIGYLIQFHSATESKATDNDVCIASWDCLSGTVPATVSLWNKVNSWLAAGGCVLKEKPLKVASQIMFCCLWFFKKLTHLEVVSLTVVS